MKRVAWIAAVLAVGMGVALAAGTAGFLDGSFGDDGTLITEADGHVFAVAFESSGDLIAVGVDQRETDAWVVRRYGSDGTLKDTFGATPGATDDFALAVAIDGSGRIVVAGEATVTSTGGRGKKQKTVTERHLAVARFLANGNLDSNFGDGGVASVALSWSRHPHLAIQSDGKILVATDTSVTVGKGKKRTTSEAFVVVRFDSDGALDSGFGDNGVVVDDATTGDDSATGIGVQSNGQIVVASFDSLGYVVRRYDADGTVDSGFGSSGVATGPVGDTIRALAIDADDRILLAGYRNPSGDSEGLVVRLDADGALDTGFASGGIWLSGSSVDEELIGIVLDGTNIVAGSLLIDGSTLDATVYRLDQNGDLDSNFGVGGVGETTPPGVDGKTGVRDIAVDSDGNIALGGENPGTGTFSDWFLARYCGD